VINVGAMPGRDTLPSEPGRGAGLDVELPARIGPARRQSSWMR
jgi:hypothetical protein